MAGCFAALSREGCRAEIIDNIYLRNAPSFTLVWESRMRWLLIVLAVVGIAASSLALREHYRTDTSPCSINERWDCGIVNHSPYAMLFGVPVAAMGGLGFALHLARIESVVLGVWCIYCAISLGVISLLSLLVLGIVIVNSMSRSREAFFFRKRPIPR